MAINDNKLEEQRLKYISNAVEITIA